MTKDKLTNREKKAKLEALEQEKMTLLTRLNRLLGMRKSVIGELMNYDRKLTLGLHEIECINGLGGTTRD